MRVYCSWRWLVGIFAMILGVVIHICMLKYLDLTLIAANSVTAIVSATVFSTQILGEVFICRYDLPALLLISAGCITIVLNANTSQTEYSAEDVKDLLKSPRTLSFIGACLVCIII